MKLHIRHSGRIIHGKKIYDNPFLYKSQLQALEGKNFVEIIEEKHYKPSKDAHGYYRGGILGTCIQTEYFSHFANEDAIHDDFFAPMFLSYTVQVVTPNKSYIQQKVRSTADLTKKEYSEFIDKVLNWCGLENIEIGTTEQYHSRYYKTITKTK